jgi:hypothetical protein
MDFLNEQMQAFYREAEITKEAILKTELEAKGLKIDFQKESKKRFPSLCKVVKNDVETWYYDNRTDEGERIVSFKFEFGGINEPMTLKLIHY